MNVLVTGADGFIGSHLVEALLVSGHHVRAFCLYNSNGSWGWLDTLPESVKAELEVVLGDIRDPLFVREAMTGCDQVFHLAALIAIPYSYLAPASYVDTNIHGTLNVVQAARDLGVSRVVHTSTSETYGSAQFVPITEEHPQVGQSPYAASKIGADQIALSYWRSFQTPVSVLRPFNTYGPRQSARAVIPTIITQVAAGQRQIRLGALSPTRDFNFVADTCAAFQAIADCDPALGQVVNAASNFEISIGDTASLIGEVMNVQLEILTDEQRMRPEGSEVNRLFGDNTLLRQLTGWKPVYGGLDGFRRGLAQTAEWFSDPANLARYRPGTYAV
ncbi:NAD-dependent 4,6-dehydratase LegB [Parasynechococcus marenigrum]|uniref:Nucleotide sugar epimerase n=1 Tax=Parasynechococcus marenigrum (strain WH8102) TaxID=84588 RepID=Q7U914_PARMW|nr:NAD-dependent 4,6-dehydratase LegB [Parasynechococcus marenigrum]CAE06960.1 Putative nucleotide sugar epimerase [Parasynechococcus marenigrum WH 8102]